MTPTKLIGLLAANIRYRYLFAVWLVMACITFQGSVEVGDASLDFAFMADIPPALIILIQVTGIAAVDLIFIKGGLRPDRQGGRSRVVIVLVKWILVPIIWTSAGSLSWFGTVSWFGMVAILLFTVFWPVLVLIGWLFKPRDQLAH